MLVISTYSPVDVDQRIKIATLYFPKWDVSNDIFISMTDRHVYESDDFGIIVRAIDMRSYLMSIRAPL